MMLKSKGRYEMNKIKRYLAFLLTVSICLSFAACDSEKNNDKKIGGDRRVTGAVGDSGRIIRNGESTDVLVCVYEKNTLFYYNDDIHIVFDCVSYPEIIQDPSSSYKYISFTDRNGDGNSDIAMIFRRDGETIFWVWLWNAEKAAYVIQNAE